MPGIREAYLKATQSTRLRVEPDFLTDADRLIAAGLATVPPRLALALDVYRLRATSDMRGARWIAERMAAQYLQQAKPRGRHPHRARSNATYLPFLEVVDLAMDTLKWWHLQACPACNGLGHPVIPGTPTLDETRNCEHCGGTGQRPMRKYLKRKHMEAAEWMVGELEGLASTVFHEMLKRMPPLNLEL
ncbi:MAG: hypothetical protein ACMV1D_07910 [Macromonas sp.]